MRIQNKNTESQNAQRTRKDVGFLRPARIHAKKKEPKIYALSRCNIVMRFKDRAEAGRLLAKALAKYENEDVVVFALPRGGVVLGNVVANYLHAQLDLLITRKIGYPGNEECASALLPRKAT